jgi:hypothetical protein
MRHTLRLTQPPESRANTHTSLLAARSDDGSGDAEMVDEEGIDVTAVMGGKKRKAGGGDDSVAAGESPAPDKPKVRGCGVCAVCWLHGAPSVR